MEILCKVVVRYSGKNGVYEDREFTDKRSKVFIEMRDALAELLNPNFEKWNQDCPAGINYTDYIFRKQAPYATLVNMIFFWKPIRLLIDYETSDIVAIDKGTGEKITMYLEPFGK